MIDNELHKRLDHLLTLERGWDGYAAEPIKPEIVAEAREWINEFPQALEFVAPLGDGGLQLETHLPNGHFFEFEITGDGVYAFIAGVHEAGILNFLEEEDALDRDGVRAAIQRWQTQEVAP